LVGHTEMHPKEEARFSDHPSCHPQKDLVPFLKTELSVGVLPGVLSPVSERSYSKKRTEVGTRLKTKAH